MNDDRSSDRLSPSICGEALDRLTESDDSLGGLIAEHGLAVREFMILSFACDQAGLRFDQLQRAVNIENGELLACIERLSAAGLARFEGEASASAAEKRIEPTRKGCEVVRQIVGD